MENQKMTMEEIVKTIENLDEVTLKDTVSLMNSDDYKVRFIAEYTQLKIRYNNLHKMLIRHEAGTLNFTPTYDISILENQAYDMNNHLNALEVRAEVEKIILPKI